MKKSVCNVHFTNRYGFVCNAHFTYTNPNPYVMFTLHTDLDPYVKIRM